MTEIERNYINRISVIVCNRYGLRLPEIQNKTNKNSITLPRQIIWSITKDIFGKTISLADIGIEVGGRDHATVLHGCKTVKNYRETSKNFDAMYLSMLDESRAVLLMKLPVTRIKYQPTIIDNLTDLLMVNDIVSMKIGIRRIIGDLRKL